MRQGGGPVSRVNRVWTQPAGPSTVGHGHLGFSGSLALGAPDPGWSGCWEGRGCWGARVVRVLGGAGHIRPGPGSPSAPSSQSTQPWLAGCVGA